jgi:integrase
MPGSSATRRTASDARCAQWSWEVPIPELVRSVFVIPAEELKSGRPHVANLNDAARSIIETQRGKHPLWVFPFRGRRVKGMNNYGWQRARRKAGLPDVRAHDLRHTFATRLRAAGVAEGDRCALLGHAVRTMPQLYASADVGRSARQSSARSRGDADDLARRQRLRS